MMSAGPEDAKGQASSAARLVAQLRLGIPFYLGLGAPAVHHTYPHCRVRAASGRSPELVRTLLALYRGEAGPEVGTVETLNFRCARITLAESGEQFFFKEFPRHHLGHDVERALRCSRVDRAWRAAHLLLRLGIRTPRAVGTAQARPQNGRAVEYLVTEWLKRAVAFPECMQGKGESPDTRITLLREFAQHLRQWHDRGVYLRDLVKNVLVCEEEGERSYWLTDLDGLHPYRWLTRSRRLHHIRQLAHWARPINSEEATVICQAYLGEVRGEFADRVMQALTALL